MRYRNLPFSGQDQFAYALGFNWSRTTFSARRSSHIQTFPSIFIVLLGVIEAPTNSRKMKYLHLALALLPVAWAIDLRPSWNWIWNRNCNYACPIEEPAVWSNTFVFHIPNLHLTTFFPLRKRLHFSFEKTNQPSHSRTTQKCNCENLNAVRCALPFRLKPIIKVFIHSSSPSNHSTHAKTWKPPAL